MSAKDELIITVTVIKDKGERVGTKTYLFSARKEKDSLGNVITVLGMKRKVTAKPKTSATDKTNAGIEMNKKRIEN